MDLFDGRVAIVTGAGNGIGRAGAILFARHGARVAIADIARDAAEETIAAIRDEGGEAVYVGGDVSQISGVKEMIGNTVATFGRLDLAFNNAGITHPTDHEWTDEAFDATMAINVRGVFQCMKHEIPEMLKQGKGAIVNTASIAAMVVSPEPSVISYSASKHAVYGMTKSAALRYARQGIRVNAVLPGVTYTNMVKGVADISPEVRRTLENLSPLGRMAMPEEIAECAIWLCSDKASFVNGHGLVADGGTVVQS